MRTLYEYYLYRKPLLWEILKFIRRREVAFIAKIDGVKNYRHLNVIKMPYLMRLLRKFYGGRTTLYNFFASIEWVKKFDGKKRIFLKTHWIRYGWDLVFDIDSKGKSLEERIKKSHKKATKIIDFLLDEDVAFFVVFTGSKGFHIYIPWQWLSKKGWNKDDYGKYNRVIASMLWEFTGVKTDPSTFSRERDLIRVPYSFHPETGYLCYPLTLEEFEDFDIEMCNPENIDHHYERGKLSRVVVNPDGNGNILSKTEVIKWLEEKSKQP